MISDGLLLISRLDLSSFVAMFWHAIFFEMPRFLLAVVAVGAVEAAGGRQTRRSGKEYRPTVSILLAGHNEGPSLRRCILGLHEQTRQDIQIVVIDDGSTDNMREVGKRLKAEGLIDVFLSRAIRTGKSASVNLGFNYCSGEIIVVADIDTSFDRDALELIVQPFVDRRVGGVCGGIAVRNADAGILARFQAIQYNVSISLGRRVSDMFGVLFIMSGAFAAFRREAFQQIGGESVGPGEDADITIKLRRAGWLVRFEPAAWALTDVPETFSGLVKQRLRWSRSLVRIRTRKFKTIFNPWSPNFSLSDALGTLDIIVFQAIMSAAFYVYVIWLFAYFGSFAWVILGAVSSYYVVTALVSFAIALSVAAPHARPSLLPYVPGNALFNAYVLRAVALYAYIDELMFRASYRDSYVPTFVSRQAQQQ